jgi:hypothetical protein
MMWTAWNNGAYHATGAGYGFKIDAADRDRHFQTEWTTVSLELPRASEPLTVEVNIDKQSFWGTSCREVISQSIGRWLIDEGYAPWPKGSPPKFLVEPSGARRFRILGPVT